MYFAATGPEGIHDLIYKVDAEALRDYLTSLPLEDVRDKNWWVAKTSFIKSLDLGALANDGAELESRFIWKMEVDPQTDILYAV